MRLVGAVHSQVWNQPGRQAVAFQPCLFVHRKYNKHRYDIRASLAQSAPKLATSQAARQSRASLTVAPATSHTLTLCVPLVGRTKRQRMLSGNALRFTRSAAIWGRFGRFEPVEYGAGRALLVMEGGSSAERENRSFYRQLLFQKCHIVYRQVEQRHSMQAAGNVTRR